MCSNTPLFTSSLSLVGPLNATCYNAILKRAQLSVWQSGYTWWCSMYMYMLCTPVVAALCVSVMQLHVAPFPSLRMWVRTHRMDPPSHKLNVRPQLSLLPHPDRAYLPPSSPLSQPCSPPSCPSSSQTFSSNSALIIIQIYDIVVLVFDVIL